MNVPMRQVSVFIMILLVVLPAACATTPAAVPTAQPIYTVVAQPKLTPGQAIPAPSGDLLLTVTGKIGAANVGDAIEMDLATLESVGLVEYDVPDPFAERTVVYTGVLISTLLEVWKVPADATTFHAIAINDYAVDIPIAELRRTPVILGLKADGEYMPVADKGPAMFVFPYGDFEFDAKVFNDYWIWQLKSIDVQ